MTIANLDAALYTKLIAASGVTALVSTKIYNLQAPAKTVCPYIVFNLASGLMDNTTPHQDMNSVYRVAGVATNPNGLQSAYAIIAACHDALHHQTLSISGWTSFMMVHEGLITDIIDIEGTQYFRVIADFRIRASLG